MLRRILSKHPLIQALHYYAGNNDDANAFAGIKKRLEELEKQRNLPGNRLFYLSVSPNFFPIIVKQLGQAGMIRSWCALNALVWYARDH